jgi:hypothetical protein
MRILDRYPVNEFGFDHSKALGCSESAQDRQAGQAALVPPAISASPSPGLTFEDRALQPDHGPVSILAQRHLMKGAQISTQVKL